MRRSLLSRWCSALAVGAVVVLHAVPGLAQITLDGTLGQAGAPPRVGSAYTIGAGLGQRHGGNLFHSFLQFNVNTGERATFTGPADIRNILARVTGPSASFIDGVLRSTILGVNLYLLNPRGVHFGPNAFLDIPGSFHVSTADSLRLADGSVFHADPARVSTLTVAPPVAFGFLAANPAGITVNGPVLQVADGQTLSLVGGDLQVSRALLASVRGRVNLASVGSAGEVVVRDPGGQPTLSPQGFTRLGHIQIGAGSLVYASGDGGGTVTIRGGSLAVESSQVFAGTTGSVDGAPLGIDIRLSGGLELRGAELNTNGSGAGRTGSIAIESGSAAIAGSVVASQAAVGAGGDIAIRVGGTAIVDGGSFIATTTDGPGSAGAIAVDAGSLSVRGGSQILSVTGGRGASGPVSVAARERLAIEGAESGIFTVTEAEGPGGTLRVTAPAIAFDDGGIATLGFGAGRAGDVIVEGRSLTVTGGGFIRSSAEGTGPGGLVTIQLADTVDISGRDDEGISSGIFAESRAGSAAGGLRVSTAALRLADDAMIQIENLGTGRAGDLVIDVGRLSLTGGSEISSIAGAGRGGDVVVTARESVSIAGQAPATSEIRTLAVGTADAGRVVVRAPVLEIGDAGSIIAQTRGPARGGAVVLEVGRLTGTGGAVIAGNTAGTGEAGGVSITATESITLIGNTPTDDTFRGLPVIASGHAGRGSGAPGPIDIVTPALDMTNAVVLGSTTSEASAGDIRVDVGRLRLVDSRIESRTTSAGGTGRVTVNASESIEITSRDQGPGAVITGIVATTEAGPGREVIVRTPVLAMDGGFISGSASGPGRGSDISLDVGTLTVRGAGQIATGTHGEGPGGNLDVRVASRMEISGGVSVDLRSGLLASSTGSGAAGNIAVTAPVVLLTDGGVIGAQTFGSGPGGAIDLRVGRLELIDAGRVDSSTFGTGRGGTVTVLASEAIRIAGATALNEESGIFSAAMGSGAAGQLRLSSPEVTVVGGTIGVSTFGAERAGDIQIQAGRLALLDGATIESSTAGAGAGGTVRIDAGSSLTVSGRSSEIRTNAQAAGPGGSIALRADRIELLDGARVSARSTGQGDAGDIAITAPLAFVARNSAVTTEARSADGGNIVLRAGDLVHLVDSQLTATVLGGEGRGGNILIGGAGDPRARFVVLRDSQVRADAFEGPGGRVNIDADVFLGSGALISASSALGLQGIVDINAAITDVSGNVARLPQAPLQAAALLREACAARFVEGRPSSLAVGGRDIIPPEPGRLVGVPVLASPAPEPSASAVPPMAAAANAPSPRPALALLRCLR